MAEFIIASSIIFYRFSFGNNIGPRVVMAMTFEIEETFCKNYIRVRVATKIIYDVCRINFLKDVHTYITKVVLRK